MERSGAARSVEPSVMSDRTAARHGSVPGGVGDGSRVGRRIDDRRIERRAELHPLVEAAAGVVAAVGEEVAEAAPAGPLGAAW